MTSRGVPLKTPGIRLYRQAAMGVVARRMDARTEKRDFIASIAILGRGWRCALADHVIELYCGSAAWRFPNRGIAQVGETGMVPGAASSRNIQLMFGLVEKHQDRIQRFIRARSGPKVLQRATLDDLYQETVTAALQSAEGFVFHDDRRFVAWICTIARRVIARYACDPRGEPTITRIKGPSSTGVGVPETQLYAKNRTPSSVVAGRERSSALADAIRMLPEHYCKALTLYKLEERPLAEVAKTLGRTKGATARLIGRAMHTLRERFAKK